MNHLYKALAGVMLSATPLLPATAQTTLCDFEQPDSYKAIAIYDTWEHSPFRAGVCLSPFP